MYALFFYGLVVAQLPETNRYIIAVLPVRDESRRLGGLLSVLVREHPCISTTSLAHFVKYLREFDHMFGCQSDCRKGTVSLSMPR